MDVSLLIRLIDQASGPAKKIADGLRRIGTGATEMKRGFGEAIRQGFSVENIETATRNAEQALDRARSRLLGGIGMALTLAAPVIKAGNFQEAFIDFANVAEIPIERMSEIEARLVAATRTTGKNKSELLEILSTYVGKGMGLEDSIAALEATGRAATATKASNQDMANASFAAMDNLKVAAVDLAKAFDVMASTGKEGSFELKDMARHFPELTASAAALEMKGVPAVASLAAALQIAMKSAGSADQAANNMSNFLGKITAGDTVKNFKKLGIDIEKELKAASEKGGDPLLRMLELVHKATDGGDQFKLNDLFADKQVKDFLNGLIPNLEEYQRIRDKAAGAEGIIDRDWINVTAGFNAQIKALSIEIDNLFSSGGALLPIAQGILQNITDIVRQVNEWTAANPELTDTIVKAVAALLAVNVAGRVLAFGIAAARLPLIRLFSAFLKFDKEGRNIARGWRLMSAAASAFGPAIGLMLRGLARIVGMVPALRNAIAGLSMLMAVSQGGAIGAVWTGLAAAIGAVGAALAGISAPAWAVIALLAAAGLAVWKFWDRISSFASGFGSVFGGIFAEAGAKIASFADKFVKFNAALFGIDPGVVDRFKAQIASAFDFSAWFATARQAIADFWASIGSIFSPEELTAQEKEAMYQAGRDLAQRLFEGIKSFLASTVGVIGDILTFDLVINWPQPPEWLKWLVERHQAAAGAAKNLLSDGWQAAKEFWNGKEATDTDAGPRKPDDPPTGTAAGFMDALSQSFTDWWNGKEDAPGTNMTAPASDGRAAAGGASGFMDALSQWATDAWNGKEDASRTNATAPAAGDRAAAGGAADFAAALSRSLSDWWNGKEGQPGAAKKAETLAKDVTGSGTKPAPGASGDSAGATPTEGTGGIAGAWSGLKSAIGLAGDDLATGGERGGKAVADGGDQAAAALRAAAADLRNAGSAIASAVSSAVSRLNAARPASGGVASAISSARTGALAGGTE